MNRSQSVVFRASRTLLLLSAMVAPTALAQGTAVLTGTIADAADPKKMLGDAVVTATSPNLQGEQIVVTDTTGLYRIPQLPPGTYTLRVEKDGYRPFSRGDIVVNSDRTLRVNISLLPEAISAEEITVVGRAPTIDIGSSSTGRTINNDFVRNIAVARPGGVGGASRSFESLALTVPQAQGDQYGVSMNGASSPESSYQVDGLSVNNPVYGINGSRTPADFMQEVNVITGGFMPEYGRSTGGTLSAITKFGGNEFHGSVYGNISPGILLGRQLRRESAATAIGTRSVQWNIADVGATLGGPILKDKLWFFVGFQPSFSRYNVERTIRLLSPDGTGETLDSSSRFADQRTFDYIANLTYLFNQDHRIRVSARGSPSSSGGPNTWGFDPQENIPSVLNGNNGSFDALGSRNLNNSTDVSVNLNSSFADKKVLVDASLGWHNQVVTSLPVDGSRIGDSTGLAATPSISWNKSDPYPHSLTEFESFRGQERCTIIDLGVDENGDQRLFNTCPALEYTTGGTGFMQEVFANSYQAKVVGTVLVNALGHHVIKAGFDGLMSTYSNTKAYSGLTALQEQASGAGFIDFRRYAYMTGPDQLVSLTSVRNNSSALSLGGFLQDSWSIMDVVTANVGVRYDSQVLRGADGSNRLSLPNQWSPRVGLVYDFTQKGQSKLFVNYSIYYENVPLQIADRALSSEPQGRGVYNAAGCDFLNNTNFCLRPENRLPRSPRNPNQYYGMTGADITAVDAAINPPASGEFVAGFEYEFFANVRTQLMYTRRNLISWIEDMSRDNATTYFIGNPGEGIATDFPKAVRNYDAVTLNVEKQFSDLWLLQASYTWSYLRGNLDGLFRPENGQLDPNINSTFDLASFLVNQNGALSADNTHRIKVYAAREQPITGSLSLNFGLGYEARSGAPISHLGANVDPGYGDGVIYILPRGSAGRLPWVHNFDGRFGVNYRLSKDYVLSASVDVFNLIGSQQFTLVDQDYTNSGVLPIEGGTVDDLTRIPLEGGAGTLPVAQVNRNFGKPIQYQAPRSFRFGVRLSF